MLVFVTGATGFVGTAVVRDLREAGHQVHGLTRSAAGAALLESLGAVPVHGTLQNTNVLRQAAAGADAVIHTAFDHDFNDFARVCALDRAAIEALGEALANTRRPLLVTSGLLLLAAGRPATESDPPPPPAHFPRVSEHTAARFAESGLPASTVRLPPTVHGEGDHAFIPRLIALAREKGVSAYIGDGTNRWAAVHRNDAARVFRLAIEQGVTSGPYHAVAEEGIAFRTIAEAIAQRLNLPTVSLPLDEAPGHFGWLTPFVTADIAASSLHTQNTLGWTPTHPTLLQDLQNGGYFETASVAA